jgi:glycosyltransferase involved in cell wall biosynthesis
MKKTIEFIIPTYNREKELKSMLASLVAQTADNWIAIVVIDDEKDPNNPMAKIVSEFRHPTIFSIFTGKRCNDWGHTPREQGKQASHSDYVIMTGDDNYYVPAFIAELNAIIEAEDPDIIYWDMVHSHYEYHYFKTALWMNQIDIGAFAVKRELGQQIPLTTAYAADGIFIHAFKDKFPDAKTVKINKVLFVHN